jgi:hypothetical protein
VPFLPEKSDILLFARRFSTTLAPGLPCPRRGSRDANGNINPYFPSIEISKPGRETTARLEGVQTKQ